MKKNTACIFLNGTPPKKSVIDKILSKCGLVVCADGAANYLKKMRITPNIILGDLDSIKPVVLRFYQKRIPIIKIADQNTTDFEKALLYCKKKSITNIFVLGFSSLEPDHTLSNYSAMKRFYKSMDITMVDNLYFVSFVVKNISFNFKLREIVSLLGFPKATNITTKGLQYPLRGETLELGVRDGTRNAATESKVMIKCSGDLLLFRKHFIR